MRLSSNLDALNSTSSNVAEGRHFDQTLGMMVPNSYDAEKNCRWAELHKVTKADLENAARAIITGGSIRKSGSPLFDKVGSGGEWDYKHGKGNEALADLGNYNWGYVAFCAGLPLWMAKAAGGIYQVKSGTSKLEWVLTGFDDPKDTASIEQGYKGAEAASLKGPLVDLIERITLEALKPEKPIVVPRVVVPVQDNMSSSIKVMQN